MTEKRNIQTVAPLLAGDFVDLDEPIFDTDKYSVFLDNNKERLSAFKKYLICKLHDSAIMDVKEEVDKFNITLNDFSTYVFADTIIEKYNLPIDADHILFPLTIAFEGNVKVEYNQVEDDGSLKQISPVALDTYLYEQVTLIGNEIIEVVFHFWKSNVRDRKAGERIIMIVSANELKIIENQNKAWAKVFENEFDNHYGYFKKQFDSDRYVSDHNECEKLIDEFERNQQTSEGKPNGA